MEYVGKDIQFKKFIFEDSFVESGMKATIKNITFDDKYEYMDKQGNMVVEQVFHIEFDQTKFIEHNKKLLTDTYYDRRNGGMIDAISAGMFDEVWADYFGVRDCENFDDVIGEYLEIIQGENKMAAEETLKKIRELLNKEVEMVDQEMLDTYYSGELGYWESNNSDDCFESGREIGSDEATLELAGKIFNIIEQMGGQ